MSIVCLFALCRAAVTEKEKPIELKKNLKNTVLIM